MNKRQHDFADDWRTGSEGNTVICNQENMRFVNEMARNTYFEDAYSVGIEDIFFRLLDHIKLIFVLAFLCAILSVAYALFFVSPKYEATAKLYVSGGIDSVTTYGVIQANTALAVDYLEAFDTWEVREMVLENLELDCSHEQLQDMVTIDIPDDTRMMHITVKHADAQLTADIANAYAAAGIAFAGDVMKVAAPDLISRAVMPSKAITHGKLFYAVMGLQLGWY